MVTTKGTKMQIKKIRHTIILTLILIVPLFTACSTPASLSDPELASAKPEWFGYELIDVQTG
jgi:hypothetical protein